MTHTITHRLKQLICFVESLLPLANSHMVDFYTNNLYQTHLSPQIRQEIDSIDPDEILNLIINQNLSAGRCPNLENFLSNCLKHSLPNFKDVCFDLSDFQLKLTEFGCKNLSGYHLDIFMTSKKSHEVEILSEIALAVSEITNTKYIVDIGDGKGYLSSFLALQNGLKVLGIDSSDVNTKGAAKRVEKLNKYWKQSENISYKQATKYVTESADILSLMKTYFPNENINNLSLVGLHTCGDLSSSCLRLFCQDPNLKTICNVGCCYHLILEDNSYSSSFPMSQYLKQNNFNLGRNARMLSCQSLDRITAKKETPKTILFYRSLLQLFLQKYYPQLLDIQVGRSKKYSNFLDYTKKILNKCNQPINISDEQINDFYADHKHLEKYLQIFYLIRAYIAPVIESIILLDRLLFLQEQNIKNSFLVQLFDPIISPRCYGIVAFKNDFKN